MKNMLKAELQLAGLVVSFAATPMVCTNSLSQALSQLLDNCSKVSIYFLPDVQMVDHTAVEHLVGVIQPLGESQNAKVCLEGLEPLRNYQRQGELFSLPGQDNDLDQVVVNVENLLSSCFLL